MVSTTDLYFALHPHCVLIKGALRAALHDLESGDVYSIDPVGRLLVEGCEAGSPLSEVLREVTSRHPDAEPAKQNGFLHQLVEAGLGQFIEQPPQGSHWTARRPPGKLNFLWLELREDCNLRCRHCYCTSDSRQRVADRVTHEEWIAVMAEAATAGCRQVQFIGGEPLLYGERVFDLAREARRLGYADIELFSNLTMLRDEWIDEIVALNLRVAVSVFARQPEIHDLVTTVPGSHRRTLESIQRLQARGVQPRFAVTVMKHNQDCVDDTMDFLRELGDPAPRYDLVRPAGRGNDHLLRPEKLAASRAYQERPMFGQVKREEFEKRFWGNSCWHGNAAVTSAGDVHPCIMQRDEPAGNVRRESLTAILENGIRRYWDLSYDRIETCRDCEYRYACKDCRPITYGPTGELTAKSLYCRYDPYRGAWPHAQETSA